jgi:rhamnose utilization protein RhaD (predicted bifunctional aldolase and dehydrogenase)
VHQSAFHEDSLRIASTGSLYPDHVVFLGPRSQVFDRVEQIHDQRDCKMAFIKGVGTLIRDDLSPGALSMATCLGRVLAELAGHQGITAAELSFLTPEHEAELMGWDAEAYRKQLDSIRRHKR